MTVNKNVSFSTFSMTFLFTVIAMEEEVCVKDSLFFAVSFRLFTIDEVGPSQADDDKAKVCVACSDFSMHHMNFLASLSMCTHTLGSPASMDLHFFSGRNGNYARRRSWEGLPASTSTWPTPTTECSHAQE